MNMSDLTITTGLGDSIDCASKRLGRDNSFDEFYCGQTYRLTNIFLRSGSN